MAARYVGKESVYSGGVAQGQPEDGTGGGKGQISPTKQEKRDVPKRARVDVCEQAMCKRPVPFYWPTKLKVPRKADKACQKDAWTGAEKVNSQKVQSVSKETQTMLPDLLGPTPGFATRELRNQAQNSAPQCHSSPLRKQQKLTGKNLLHDIIKTQ